jgi:hypothetical protein
VLDQGRLRNPARFGAFYGGDDCSVVLRDSYGDAEEEILRDVAMKSRVCPARICAILPLVRKRSVAAQRFGHILLVMQAISPSPFEAHAGF